MEVLHAGCAIGEIGLEGNSLRNRTNGTEGALRTGGLAPIATTGFIVHREPPGLGFDQDTELRIVQNSAAALARYANGGAGRGHETTVREEGT